MTSLSDLLSVSALIVATTTTVIAMELALKNVCPQRAMLFTLCGIVGAFALLLMAETPRLPLATVTYLVGCVACGFSGIRAKVIE